MLQHDASLVSNGSPNGIYSLITNTRAQQVAKETNQVESIFQRPSIRKPLPSLSRRNVHRIAPSDAEKLYEDITEDTTLQWTIPDDLYTDNLNDGNKLT